LALFKQFRRHIPLPVVIGGDGGGFLVQPYYLPGNQFAPVRKKTYFFAYRKFAEGYKLARLLKKFDAVHYNPVQGIQLFEAEAFGHFSKPVDGFITEWWLHGGIFQLVWQKYSWFGFERK
jgi:hypothetical protein